MTILKTMSMYDHVCKKKKKQELLFIREKKKYLKTLKNFWRTHENNNSQK